VLVSPGFDIGVKAGPARRYLNVMMTVHVVNNVSGVRKIAADYARKQKHFDAVCLASSHGDEYKPRVMWKVAGQWTLTKTAVEAVARITSRVHIITCWLFLHKISVPGVVLSAWSSVECMHHIDKFICHKERCFH
jgi:hypothetical protein